MIGNLSYEIGQTVNAGLHQLVYIFFITVAFLHGEFFSFKEFSKKRADYGRHSTRNTPYTREQLVGIPFYILPIYCKLFTIHYYLTL